MGTRIMRAVELVIESNKSIRRPSWPRTHSLVRVNGHVMLRIDGQGVRDWAPSREDWFAEDYELLV